MVCDIFMMKMAVNFTPTSFIVWDYWIFKTIELHLIAFFHAKINENFTAIKIWAYIFTSNESHCEYECVKYVGKLWIWETFFRCLAAAVNAKGIKRFLHVWDINICNMKIAYHLWILSTRKKVLQYTKQQNIKKDWILFFGNELQFEEQKILEKKMLQNFYE